MTKKFVSITITFLTAVIIISCNDVRRNSGRVYMPDMAYSRALETYAKLDSAKFTNNPAERGEGKIYYTAYPVAGAMARGDELPFAYAIDKPGDTTNYIASKQVTNPLPALDAGQMKEAERLFLVNCAICHGPKLDGNGPLWKDGSGPFTSAPKNLMTLDMPDGQMFYSITYGKNMMGSYASQITDRQRWMVIHYIKAQQSVKNASAKLAASDSTGANAKTDSTAKAK
jgi:mono/diheme cytochrome c family protein